MCPVINSLQKKFKFKIKTMGWKLGSSAWTEREKGKDGKKERKLFCIMDVSYKYDLYVGGGGNYIQNQAAIAEVVAVEKDLENIFISAPFQTDLRRRRRRTPRERCIYGYIPTLAGLNLLS